MVSNGANSKHKHLFVARPFRQARKRDRFGQQQQQLEFEHKRRNLFHRSLLCAEFDCCFERHLWPRADIWRSLDYLAVREKKNNVFVEK